MGYPKMVHFHPDTHAWIKRCADRQHMTMSGYLEMCARRFEGATKKILPALPSGKPADLSRAPFYARPTRRG